MPRLFCIDDEEEIASTLLTSFKKEAFEVSVFTNPMAALESVPILKPAVVVCDYRMPWMNGLTVLEKIRDLDPTTIRLLLSGVPDENDVIAALKSGVVHRALFKPWQIKELRAEIRRWFEFHRDRDPKVLYPSDEEAS